MLFFAASPSTAAFASISIGGMSTASAIGLGDSTGVDRNDSHPSRESLRATASPPGPSRDSLRDSREPSASASVRARIDVEPGTGRNASAYHSYQTCRWFVRRQIETCSSDELGRYSGSWRQPPSAWGETTTTRDGPARRRINETNLEGKQQREPAQHVLRDVLHAVGVYAEPDVAV